ncbi:DUF551 domain-containing protein [Christiangramia forsetii]|uniref:DUF551 domain-containing protein n=2 Tax=Christiangramia forsetii TaxID=411153 RepID=A0M472_CHRFK|nr:DUF551 domain-containing protein [Christiangramia forsetii]GGG24089.1 hypothetical protein GCM10011532_04150 [Christiangramia forsetii]CAL67417.1 hypothetical protein GFO_2461 [Christiangramia forsetii KT0803]
MKAEELIKERPKLKDYRSISGRINTQTKDKFIKDLQNWSYKAEDMLLSLTKDQTEEEKWISVEDRLPETGIPVVIYGINDYGKERRLRAFYAPKFSIYADCYEGDNDEYCEEKDEYFIPEGWYEQNEYECTNWYVGFKPTHWQPLPTPPKQ